MNEKNLISVRTILKSLNVYPGVDDALADDDLFALGLLDSLVVVQYVIAIEDEFKIQFKNSEINYRNFKSFTAITELVESKKLK